MEVILGHLRPNDVILWSDLPPVPASPPEFLGLEEDHSEPRDWPRLAKHTTSRRCAHSEGAQPSQAYQAGDPSAPSAPTLHLHGYKRVVPARDRVLLWDYQGTLHLLRHDGATGLLSRPTILCRNAKNFAVDPCSNTSSPEYVYVSAGPEDVNQGTNV